MNWFEIVGVTFGLLCVWLTAKQSIWCWPIGIISVVLFGITLFTSKLYPETTLQGFFLVQSIYGWWKWREIRIHNLPITRMVSSDWKNVGMILLLFVPLIGFLFHRYSETSFPYIDTFISILSVVATYYLSKKSLENWFMWMFVDIVSIPVHVGKGLYYYSVMDFILLLICIKGYKKWKKELQA